MCTPSYYSQFYTVIGQIPVGNVLSYADVAKAAGLPRHARWVGRSLKALPEGSSLPWHRVIKSDGRIAFPANSDHFNEQIRRLKTEGIIVENGRCTYSRYRWRFA